MQQSEIIALFGYSEYSPEINSLFKQLHIPPEQPAMSICWRNYRSEKWDIHLVFKEGTNYQYDYGPYVKAFKGGRDEAFLEEISFGSQKGETNYPYSLPFDFTFSDKPEDVFRKTGIKTQKAKEASYGSYIDFNTEEYQYVTGFDKSNKLIWVRVRPLEASFKKKRELEKSLRQQSKHLQVPDAKLIEQLQSKSPAHAWRKRMKKGDNIFTEKNIADTGNALNKFLDSIITAAGQKKANGIYAAVKKLVLSMNKLNEKYEGFIETLEREELVDYINKAVKLTGFTIDKEVDVTEEWREW